MSVARRALRLCITRRVSRDPYTRRAVSWSAPSQRWMVYLLVALVALAVRFGFWAQIRGTPLDAWHTWEQTDMATYVEQARRLAAGDWLAREPYHPYHAWQREVATEAEWLHWYAPLSFHQAPLYSYALAALSKLRTDYLPLVKGLQLVLGAGTCLLLAHVAGRIGGLAVAAVAGGIAAIYGPLYYLEPQLLREGPAVFGSLVVLWATMRHAELPRESPLRRLAVSASLLGLLIGVYALFHETAAVLALAVAAVVTVHAASADWRRPAAVVAALLAGSVMGLAPLLARNAAVGVPLWTSGSRLGINLALCNMSSAPDGGTTFAHPGPQFEQIMDASGGATFGILREVWRGYDGERMRLFLNWAHRFRVTWASPELPDNTSFGFYRRHSSILRASLSFRWIFPAAAAVWATWLVGRLWRAWQPSSRRGDETEDATAAFRLGPWLAAHAGAHWTLALYALLMTLAMSVNLPQSRYRLFVVPLFIVYTSLALVAAARLMASRRMLAAAGLCGATAAFVAFHAWVSAPYATIEDRFADYEFASSMYRRWGDEAAAEEYLRRRIIEPSHRMHEQESFRDEE